MWDVSLRALRTVDSVAVDRVVFQRFNLFQLVCVSTFPSVDECYPPTCVHIAGIHEFYRPHWNNGLLNIY